MVYNVVPGMAQDAGASGTPPLGANDWGCEPSEEHPDPIVLVHGPITNATDDRPAMSPLLAHDGCRAFVLTCGVIPELPPWVGRDGADRESAEEFGGFVAKVLMATGAEKVDLVGRFQGTTMPQHYPKFLGGAPKAQRYVASTPVCDGTSLHDSSELSGQPVAEVPAAGRFGVRAVQASFPGSEFMEEVSEGAGIEHTTIMVQFDELVTPCTSGSLAGRTPSSSGTGARRPARSASRRPSR